MSDVFNTEFEVSLRILLTLESSGQRRLSADMIAATDFITVYGREFGVSDENLHGENNYKFGEFALRREVVKDSLKSLVLDGFVYVDDKENGFTYYLNDRGQKYAAKFNSEYAVNYRSYAQKANEYLSKLSEREALKQINNHSIMSLKRGEVNG